MHRGGSVNHARNLSPAGMLLFRRGDSMPRPGHPRRHESAAGPYRRPTRIDGDLFGAGVLLVDQPRRHARQRLAERDAGHSVHDVRDLRGVHSRSRRSPHRRRRRRRRPATRRRNRCRRCRRGRNRLRTRVRGNHLPGPGGVRSGPGYLRRQAFGNHRGIVHFPRRLLVLHGDDRQRGGQCHPRRRFRRRDQRNLRRLRRLHRRRAGHAVRESDVGSDPSAGLGQGQGHGRAGRSAVFSLSGPVPLRRSVWIVADPAERRHPLTRRRIRFVRAVRIGRRGGAVLPGTRH